MPAITGAQQAAAQFISQASGTTLDRRVSSNELGPLATNYASLESAFGVEFRAAVDTWAEKDARHARLLKAIKSQEPAPVDSGFEIEGERLTKTLKLRLFSKFEKNAVGETVDHAAPKFGLEVLECSRVPDGRKKTLLWFTAPCQLVTITVAGKKEEIAEFKDWIRGWYHEGKI